MVALREYRTEDLEAIFRLDVVCFEEAFRFNRESMRRFATARGAVTLVAETEGEGIVGFVIVQVGGTGAGRRGYVVTLDVSPACRRGGVAARLMEEVEQRVAASEVSRMELHVYTENGGAVEFYERRGYGRVRMVRDFYGWGLDAWVYCKEPLEK
jgi:ribosomal-protein-alanine N-acetyltransferase